jgi:hypothetical protein
MYSVWVWRLARDVGWREVPFFAGVALLTSTVGCLKMVARDHNIRGSLMLFGTLYALMLLVTWGRPARLVNYRGQIYVGTRRQVAAYQVVLLVLFLAFAIAVTLLGRYI